MRSLRSGRPPRIEVFVRSFAPPIGVREQQDRVLSRLSNLERRGVLETVSVDVWGKAVCPDGHCGETRAGERILDRVEAFSAWARDLGVPVESPFEECTVSASTTGEEFKKIVLPRLCIGIYSDTELEAVLPCQLDGDPVSIDDFLSALEAVPATDRGIGTSA
jgi:hypothetical protein